jgi:hypothetical protein
MNNFITRTLTGVVFALSILASIYFQESYFTLSALFSVFCVLGLYEFYKLVNLGGGWYGIEYKDNTIAPNIKNGTIKLNVFLQGNNPANNNPNAIVSVKITNVKFK